MARILYFSTHEPLEYDDIRLFMGMGQTIFSLGKFCPANAQVDGTYRGKIAYGPDIVELVALFAQEKCQTAFLQTPVLTAKFINAFDLVIFVQAIGIVELFWPMIDGPRVIWRTVGQAIDHHDAVAERFRRSGMHIVRWSDREAQADVYVGHDAVIRGYKDPAEYAGWTGEERRIVTFSNHFRQRYAHECGMTERILAGLPYAIGGAENDSVPGAIGLLPLEEMRATIRRSRGYLYSHGAWVPYTLNFIEAWMTGIPVVAASRDIDIEMKYNEINDLILDGVSGFLFRSEGHARDILHDLLADETLARNVGAAGREMAVRFFGIERARADWTHFFASIGGSDARST